MSYRGKNAAVMSAINVIPMADIMLVLLIILMVITPLLGPGIAVDLAATQNPREMKEADREDELIVAITRDGAIYLRAEQLTPGLLGARVADALASRPDKIVFVKSDRRAKFGAVVAVVDEIRTAGVDRLGLLTEKSFLLGDPERRTSWE